MHLPVIKAWTAKYMSPTALDVTLTRNRPEIQEAGRDFTEKQAGIVLEFNIICLVTNCVVKYLFEW
jgi:hypothetical protein